MSKNVYVEDENGVILASFDSVLEAKAYITGLEVIDAAEVYAGNYGIDAPEDKVNPNYKEEFVETFEHR